MRVIVFGMGAIGGVVAGALVHSGQEAIGVARGGMLEAVRATGLHVLAPDQQFHAAVPVVGRFAGIDLRPDDAILLCMKSQGTEAALADLQAAGVRDQPIFCVQNGVANEPLAARLFPNVHGVTVMMPASYVAPGQVAVFCKPKFGVFELGLPGGGTDEHDIRLAGMLGKANIHGESVPDVMAGKHGKLLLNLSNIVEAAIGPDADRGELPALLRDEAKSVFVAAGIEWRDVGADIPLRKEMMKEESVAGLSRSGGSTTQSLMRGTGTLETDYLNGEIVRLGRLSDVPTPLNAALVKVAERLLREKASAGSMTLDALLAEIGA